jgi:quercetin dioxygenase-like cupin family protein
MFYIGESGNLTARTTGPATISGAEALTTAQPARAQTDMTIAPGTVLAIPPGTALELRNDADTPATVVVVFLVPGSGEPFSTPTPDTHPWDLLGANPVGPLPLPTNLHLERRTVAPGMEVATGTTSAIELYAVEKGVLTAGIQHGLAEISPAITFMKDGDSQQVREESAIFVYSGTTRHLTNAGDEPLSLLVLTLTPSKASTPSGAAMARGGPAMDA